MVRTVRDPGLVSTWRSAAQEVSDFTANYDEGELAREHKKKRRRKGKSGADREEVLHDD